MTVHTLKTDPEVFAAVLSGEKTFEIRLNDRDFKVGDALHLLETASTGAEMKAGAPLTYTGRKAFRTVSHVLTGYGLAEGWCCLSFAQPPEVRAWRAARREVERTTEVYNAALIEARARDEVAGFGRTSVDAEYQAMTQASNAVIALVRPMLAALDKR